tara:strand:+ start:136 stop:300 length:165 start_codon:yes stop_codon:yes gene_type:complete
MIDEEKTSELTDEKMVVLKDEHGMYITYKDRLDNGLADPKRTYPPRPPLTQCKK